MQAVHQHAPSDGLCANCGTQLLGPWCHNCGQHAANHHRSLRHLASELAESLTHADGRLWRTLRLLAFHPAQLTRDYLQGRRAAEIPPLRLFFVALLLFFAAGSLTGSLGPTHVALSANNTGDITHRIETIAIAGHPSLTAWLRAHLQRALAAPDELFEAMRAWSERVAILLLPLSALSLRLLFLFDRKFSLFDHLVFAMHSLSFTLFVWTTAILLSAANWLPAPVVIALLFLVTLHLYTHLRGVYAAGGISTLLRMAALAIMTAGTLIFLALLLVLISFGSLHA